MADASVTSNPGDLSQLTQVQVPLDEAQYAFAQNDASGRIPIVVMTTRPARIEPVYIITAGVLIAGGILAGGVFQVNGATPLGIVLGVLVLAFGVYRSFMVRIPEGASALLTKAGKYAGTIGPGLHVIPSWIFVSHLVTRREIPFDVPVVDAPTQDDVRASADALVTFNIEDPYKFVFSISAMDFDHVFQASCQYAVRSMIRSIVAEKVNDLVGHDLGELKDSLGRDVEPYGVRIQRLKITYARPPEDFQRAKEGQQLAVYLRQQQAEEFALTQRRQADQEILARQQAIAKVERLREELQAQVQQAEMRKQLTEVEAQTMELRLARLQEALTCFPEAAEWEWQTEQLNVARALAGNTRAVLQIGSASDIVRAFTVREALESFGRPPANLAPGDLPDAPAGDSIDQAKE